MKKFMPLLLLAAVVFISGCTEKQIQPEDVEWETFTFPGVFSIEYPSDWTYPEGFVVTQPQKTFKGDDFEIGVTVIEALEGETLETVYQSIISEQESKGREVTYQADITWFDSTAKTAEITIPEEGKRRQITLALKDGKFVLLDYVAPEIRFYTALLLTDYMKESFKLL